MTELAAVSGYAVVVAVTTLPVLAVISVLLDSGKASRGWALTGGYAVALVVVFVVASFGLDQVPFPRLRFTGVTEIAAGLLLFSVAAWVWLWQRRRTRRPPTHASHRRGHAHAMSAPRAVFVGIQFAFHPENLALTFAAVSHVTAFDWPGRVATAVWFAVVGVSTVAMPSLAYAIAGDRTRDRLAGLRDSIVAHGFLLTELLLVAVGSLLIGAGLWRVLSL